MSESPPESPRSRVVVDRGGWRALRRFAVAFVAVAALVAIAAFGVAAMRADGAAPSVGAPIGMLGHDEHAAPHEGHEGHDGHGAHGAAAVEDPGPDPAAQAVAPLGDVQVQVDEHPQAMALHDGVLWVLSRVEGTAQPLDPRTLQRAGPPVHVAAEPVAVVEHGGLLWIADFDRNEVVRFHPATASVVGDAIRTGSRPTDLAVTGGWIVTTNSADGTLTRVDAVTGQAESSGRLGFGLTAIADADGRLWVSATLDRTVLVVDPSTLTLAAPPIPVDAGAAAVIADGTAVWVASSSTGTLTRIDTTTASADRSAVVDAVTDAGHGPAGIATGGGRVCATNNHDRTLVCVSGDGRVIEAPRYFARSTTDARGLDPVLIRGTDAWVADHAGGTVTRFTIG